MEETSAPVVIVTGGGTGIGRAIAEKFAANGAGVVISGRRESPLEALSARHPDSIRFIAGDVTRPEDRRRLIDGVLERHGRIDVIVNNAGIAPLVPFAQTSDEDFEQTYLTNLVAPAGLIRDAIPHLAATMGSVVNISTIGARAVLPGGSSAYTCSKAALNQLTRVLAVELGPLGIRVNAVAPGMTRTEMTASALEGTAIGDSMLALTPLGRFGEPEDIANTVYLLASSEAAWVTGQIVDSAGGLAL